MERTPEETKIQMEIEMFEAEARLCRDFANAEPARSAAYLLRRAKRAEIAAHNARIFLNGRIILGGR